MEEDKYIKTVENEESGEERKWFHLKAAGVEGFLGRTLGGENSRLTWGIVLLVAFAVYALVNLVLVVLKIFN